MFGNHHCSLRGKALPYKGICYECQPAPKEEGMDLVKTNCKTCGIPLLNLEVCYKCSERTATLRAHYDAAYLAALGGSAISDTADRDVRNADALALESVRTHAERMRKLERLIEEVANG